MSVLSRFSELYEELTSVTPDRLRQLYADDILFIDPIQTHQGIESVIRYFEALLVQAESCRFAISNTIPTQQNAENIDYIVTWTMTLKVRQSATPIVLDGITQLKVSDDRITYHRDYYDLGQMVYEHIPLLGWAVKRVKKRLAI
ncbi:nuclear transport factor 2 family protein [Alteromonas sp. CYL-A6]|uniref:nuclear transport factor 2 family protein n=1 Tax=Alteromonas nitratireducens TaxID=3390813 RepID=UPI0034B2C794